VNLITDKNVSDYIKNIPECFSRLCPAHQADFVRVNVICDYGGIWLDSDTIVMEPLDSLFDMIELKNGFFIKQLDNKHFCNGIFGSKKETPLIVKWKNTISDILRLKGHRIGWCEIGGDILDKFDSTLYNDYEIMNGKNNVFPVDWQDCVKEFIDSPYDNYKNIIRDYQPVLILVNSVYKKLESMEHIQILRSNMPLNYFINKSFRWTQAQAQA